jgi:hypothetical protein
MTARPSRTAPSRTAPRRWRWIRAVLPLAVVLALTAFTLIAHLVQRPDPTDRDFLAPDSTADIGAATLAARLRSRGVSVQRETRTPAALAAAAAGNATLFVPAPGLVYPDYLRLFRSLPEGSRVVLVAPPAGVLGGAGLDVAVGGPRWTAAAVAPDCAAEWAAGSAAVLRLRFAAPGESCYRGGVLDLRAEGAAITLVGAPDPFRNDRLGEHDNAAVAAGLLSRTRRVVWLDLHDHERPPPVQNPTAEPTAGPTRGEAPQPDPDGTGDPQPGDGGDRPDAPPRSSGESDQPDIFPPAVWATLALLALATIALAAAQARRLGAPVAEPLPVRVRAAETVRGLGGLYRRARADEHSLATVQAAARRRLATYFGCPPEQVAARAAAATGRTVAEISYLLTVSADDQDVAGTAAAVQDLVRHITEEKMT